MLRAQIDITGMLWIAKGLDFVQCVKVHKRQKMNILVKCFKKEVPYRWYKKGKRVFQLTPQEMFDKEYRYFLYEYIENNYKSGCHIIGFYLYDDMDQITEDEWKNALKNCMNAY